MRRSDRREAPPDWGCDSLTRYFDAVRANQFASYHNKRIVAQDLIRVDRLLADALYDWQDPAAMMPAMLFYRSHAAFRAGAGAALAGQTAEAPCLLRLCLECAGYAAVIGKKHQTAETFLRRSDGESAKKRVRAAFDGKSIKAAVRALNVQVGSAFDRLYESLIDFGAHPNEQMIVANSRMVRGELGTKIDSLYLRGDSQALDLTLRLTVQVGICSAKIFSAVFPERAAQVGTDALIEAIAPVY